VGKGFWQIPVGDGGEDRGADDALVVFQSTTAAETKSLLVLADFVELFLNNLVTPNGRFK
jgi:hypothetical protein